MDVSLCLLRGMFCRALGLANAACIVDSSSGWTRGLSQYLLGTISRVAHLTKGESEPCEFNEKQCDDVRNMADVVVLMRN